MKNLLVVGAGRSSGSLIQYLLKHAAADGYHVRVGDRSVELALEKTGNHPSAIAFEFDIENEAQRAEEIEAADLVVSLLPPALHILAARDCVRFGKNLVTASYVSAEIQQLHDDAVAKNIILLNECGLDPGIDHMSAMEIIHRLQDQGADITSFKSYTGGLVAPESNDNPWGYKFTWNPRNVIVAGQGTAKFIQNGRYHYTPYSRLFTEITPISVEGLGSFDGYANRDSLAYRKHYGIENIPTLIRGTLRQGGYCKAWQIFVTLGLTDDTYVIEDSENLTYAEIVEALIPAHIEGASTREKLAKLCAIDANDESMEMIAYTGIFENQKTGMKNATPAQILQQVLERKWVLKPGDKDMIVMQHQFEYTVSGQKGKIISTLVVKGSDTTHTAMAKTVGLPLGIAARMILYNKISLKGVQIPVHKEIYAPILTELSGCGVKFEE